MTKAELYFNEIINDIKNRLEEIKLSEGCEELDIELYVSDVKDYIKNVLEGRYEFDPEYLQGLLIAAFDKQMSDIQTLKIFKMEHAVKKRRNPERLESRRRIW